MQFMAALFGADSPALNAGFALGIVLVLIVLSAWVLKLFTRAGNSVARGRNKRLSVVDSAVVDAKRKVVIIRRDNVEHVIMTGGPTDLVIEFGRAGPRSGAAAPRRPRSPDEARGTARAAGGCQASGTPSCPSGRSRVDRPTERADPAGAAQAGAADATHALGSASSSWPDIHRSAPARR